MTFTCSGALNKFIKWSDTFLSGDVFYKILCVDIFHGHICNRVREIMLLDCDFFFVIISFVRAAGESFLFLCKSLCHLQTYTSKQFKPNAWNFNYLSWIVFTKASLWPLANTANRDLVVEFWSLGREKNRKPQREWLWSSVSTRKLTDKHKFRGDMPEKFHWLRRFKSILAG